MKHLLLPAILFTGITTTAMAGGSLFNRANERPATSDYTAVLGPKSGRLHYDSRMLRAAEIATMRAETHMTWFCWRYVKNALLEAGLVSSRPSSAYAKQAGDELCGKYGFTKLSIRNPYKAPVGAVIVYGGPDAGHVEIRTRRGFVSDFFSPTAYHRPLIGVFVKQA
jgi:hypothetical protein